MSGDMTEATAVNEVSEVVAVAETDGFVDAPDILNDAARDLAMSIVADATALGHNTEELVLACSRIILGGIDLGERDYIDLVAVTNDNGKRFKLVIERTGN